jgi:hypothetical protein
MPRWRRGGTIRRVILLGPTHRVAVEGIALPEAKPSPPRSAPSRSTRRPSRASPTCRRSSSATACMPRSIRWRCTCPSCSACSTTSPWFRSPSATPPPEAVAEVLDLLWGGPETLIVISSDLSHFLPYGGASRSIATPAAHPATRPHLGPNRPAAPTPINGLLLAARRAA